MKARDGKLDSFHKDKGNIEKGWPFHTEYWTWKYVYMQYVCIIMASEASQKKNW